MSSAPFSSNLVRFIAKSSILAILTTNHAHAVNRNMSYKNISHRPTGYENIKTNSKMHQQSVIQKKHYMQVKTIMGKHEKFEISNLKTSIFNLTTALFKISGKNLQ